MLRPRAALRQFAAIRLDLRGLGLLARDAILQVGQADDGAVSCCLGLVGKFFKRRVPVFILARQGQFIALKIDFLRCHSGHVGDGTAQ